MVGCNEITIFMRLYPPLGLGKFVAWYRVLKIKRLCFFRITALWRFMWRVAKKVRIAVKNLKKATAAKNALEESNTKGLKPFV